MTELPKLLTARELEERIGIRRARLYELVRSGAIPHVRLGESIRFDPDRIRRWIDEGGSRTGT